MDGAGDFVFHGSKAAMAEPAAGFGDTARYSLARGVTRATRCSGGETSRGRRNFGTRCAKLNLFVHVD